MSGEPISVERSAPSGARPPRVAVVVSQLGLGGAERQTVHLLEGLKDDPWRPVAVLCLSEDTAPLGSRVLDAAYPLVTLPRRGHFDPLRLLRLRSELRRQRVEVVHAVHLLASGYVHVATRVLRGLQVVPSVRGTVVRPGPIRSFVYKRMFDAAPVTLVNSERGARFIEANFDAPHRRVVVVRNGIDFEGLRRRGAVRGLRGRLNVPADAPLLCYVGKRSTVKNIGRLCRVWRDVATRVPTAHLVLVGGGLSELPPEATGLALPRERTHALGPRDDVPAILAESDLLILTSNSEGTPNVVLEALALGVPVVSTDVGDVREIVRDGRTGRIAPSDDDALLVQGVLEILGSLTESKHRVAEDLPRLQSLYSLDGMIRATIACWRRAIDSTASSRDREAVGQD